MCAMRAGLLRGDFKLFLCSTGNLMVIVYGVTAS